MSKPALLLCADALIGITPLTPVNEVGNAETFTVTATAFPAGTGADVRHADGDLPGGAPGTVGTVTPLAGPTQQPDGSWVETWTETINSAAAGTFNVQASDTVTMGGVAVTRTTGDGFSDSDGSDSPSAVKNYVDAEHQHHASDAGQRGGQRGDVHGHGDGLPRGHGRAELRPRSASRSAAA